MTHVAMFVNPANPTRAEMHAKEAEAAGRPMGFFLTCAKRLLQHICQQRTLRNAASCSLLYHHVLALHVAGFVEGFTKRIAKARGALG